MPEEPVPGALLAAEIAELFDKLKIPSILWGWLAIGFAGSTYGIPEVDFIIPDHHIPQAVVEVGSRYPVCRDPNCLEWKGDRTNVPDFALGLAICTAQNGFHTPSEAHFHIGDADADANADTPLLLLSLHKKSQLLPWLPDYKHGPPPQNDPHLTVSSDPALPPPFPRGIAPTYEVGPTGPWTGLYSIQIMNPNSLTESILYVMALYEQDPKMKGLHWSRVFNMMQFALAEDHRPPIPAYQRRLRPQYRLVWKWLHLEGIPGIHEKAPLLRLREHMTRTGELPADLPTYDFSEVYLNWHRLRSHMDEELVVHLEDIPCPSALPGAWPV